MANPFVHIELKTRDLAGAKDFYSRHDIVNQHKGKRPKSAHVESLH